jgi:hypothetical protein
VKTAVGSVCAELIVTLSDRALTAVDEAITAAVAPDGLLAHRICNEVTAAVTTAVDKLVTETVTSRIHDTLDDVFTSYRDCILHERKLAEEGLLDFITAQQELARTEYQEFLMEATTATIATIDAMIDAGKAKIEATI